MRGEIPGRPEPGHARGGGSGEPFSARDEKFKALVDSAAAAYRLSDARYQSGIDSYLAVLDSQRALYGAQQGLISIRLARLANLVKLYKVLGGG